MGSNEHKDALAGGVESNRYVYPYVPFENLADKDVRSNFNEAREESFETMRSLVSKEILPDIPLTGDAPSERILSLFENEHVRFGPVSFIEDERDSWLGKMNQFVREDQPLQFVLLGFPFKMAVPLKTDRVLPDLGEMLSLRRLENIAAEIKKTYPPGGVITVFGEGAFAKTAGVPGADANAYFHYLEDLNRRMGLEGTVNLKELSGMESMVPDFEERYARKVEELKALYGAGDPGFMEKYQGTYPSVSRLVSTKDVPEGMLMDVYNDGLPDSALNNDARAVREDIKARAQEATFLYHAYLGLRDDLNFIDTEVPHALHLTVSPKPGRLGVIPVNEHSVRLPYHGVPVHDRAADSFSIEYLIDIKRRPRNYTPVHLEGDKDNKPFYYAAEA